MAWKKKSLNYNDLLKILNILCINAAYYDSDLLSVSLIQALNFSGLMTICLQITINYKDIFWAFLPLLIGQQRDWTANRGERGNDMQQRATK